MQAHLLRKTFRALGAAALLIGSIPAIAQTTSASNAASHQAESQQAIAVITSYSSIDATVTVPGTNKPLPLDGSWGRSNSTDSCPKTKYSCVHILYRIPTLGVSCEWTVLLRETVAQGVILDINDDAARYFTSKNLASGDAQPRVIEKISDRPAFMSPIAKAAHTSGAVKMLAHIDETGHVDNVRVISGPEVLRKSATDAVKEWVYKPLKIDSVAVSITLPVTVFFHS